MKILTYQSSIHLRDAGFPQPEPQFGQIWYDTLNPGVFGIITESTHNKAFTFSPILGGFERVAAHEFGNRFVYAATGEDILPHLPKYIVEFEPLAGGRFFVSKSGHVVCYDSRSMHEALAGAYIYIYKNKKRT